MHSTGHTLLGIRRAERFSPGSKHNDSAILEAVSAEIRKHGYNVCLCTEEEFVNGNHGIPQAIFGMARSEEAIEKLQLMEQNGIPTVNSSAGIRNCSHANFTQLFAKHSIPQPESKIISTDSSFCFPSFPCWIKRGEGCAQDADDVSFIQTQEEGAAVLRALNERNIQEAVVCQHLTGDLIKFYGVRGTDFFHSFYPTAMQYSKFGLEQHNGLPNMFDYEAEKLKYIATQAAKATGIEIYGGDCIVQQDDSILLIDFNDWPSFSCCRTEAATYIADCIMKHIRE